MNICATQNLGKVEVNVGERDRGGDVEPKERGRGEVSLRNGRKAVDVAAGLMESNKEGEDNFDLETVERAICQRGGVRVEGREICCN